MVVTNPKRTTEDIKRVHIQALKKYWVVTMEYQDKKAVQFAIDKGSDVNMVDELARCINLQLEGGRGDAAR